MEGGYDQMQYMITRSDELYHHGISGQRWGIRRFQNPDGTRTAAGKKREAKARETDSMSDEELRNKVNRLQNEQNYTRIMSARNQSKAPQMLRNAANAIRIGGSALEVANDINKASSGRTKMSTKGVTDPNQKARIEAHNKEVEEYDKNYKDVKSMIGDTRGIADGTARLSDQVTRNKGNKKIQTDLKKMSDAELKKQINRLLLEEQYDRLVAPQRVSKGERFMNTYLPAIATTVGILGSVTSLAVTFMDLKARH